MAQCASGLVNGHIVGTQLLMISFTYYDCKRCKGYCVFICGWFTYAYFCGLSENKTVLCAEVRGPSNLLIQLRKWTVQRAGTTTFLLIQEVWKKRCQYRRGERRAWFIGGGILEWVRIMEAWKKYFGDHKNTTFVLNTILARISETRNSCIYIYIKQRSELHC